MWSMKLVQELEAMTKHYPRFADGRIDYTQARVCPVVNCTVMYGDEVLLTFRSAEVIAYPETWSGVSGFVDVIQPLEKTVLTELEEEVGIAEEHVEELVVFDKIVQADEALGREWHVFPAYARLQYKPEIRTNWENKHAVWVPRHEVLEMALLPGYRAVFECANAHHGIRT